MTLREISYSILEVVREGAISDDERLSPRLIDSWVKVKRAEYLKQLSDTGKPISDNNLQSIDLTLNMFNLIGNSNVLKSGEVPNIVSSKNGLLINEVSSVDLFQYPFTVVNKSHFRFAGNGKFNGNNIFVMYDNNELFFKSNDAAFNSLEECIIEAAFEDPTDVPGFDKETDDFPIDLQGIDSIKESIYRTDLRMFMNGVTDEDNDATGEIK